MLSFNAPWTQGEERVKAMLGIFSLLFLAFTMLENAPVNKATHLKCFSYC